MQLELFSLEEVRSNKFWWLDPWDICDIPGCGREVEMRHTGLCYEHQRVFDGAGGLRIGGV